MTATFFARTMRTWIFACQVLGLFPYNLSGQKITKSKYYTFHAIRFFILFIGNELFFSRYKYHFSFFGWIYEMLDVMFDIAWLFYWYRNNKILIRIFKSFDKFDEKLRVKMGLEIDQKCMLHTPNVVILLALYALNFATVFILVRVNGFSFVVCLVYGIVRSLERCIYILFTSLYLYLVYSLQFRYDKLKRACNEIIYVATKDGTFSSHSSNRILEMKLQHESLSNIVEMLNHGLGSRCVILHGQLFHLILMYFYLMFTEIKLAVLVLPFYVVPTLLISVSSHNLCSSVSTFSQAYIIKPQSHNLILTLTLQVFTEKSGNFHSIEIKFRKLGKMIGSMKIENYQLIYR